MKIVYLYGEILSETKTYSNPYKFNGKELDTETGLAYYGAQVVANVSSNGFLNKTETKVIKTVMDKQVEFFNASLRKGIENDTNGK